MVSFDPVPADSPRAAARLGEYFEARAESFPNGVYRPAVPSAHTFTPPEGVFLIVVDGQGRDVGCGGVRRIDPGPAGTRYEIKHLFLDPSTRGQGWGGQLLAVLEQYARQWGAAELVLDTHHSLAAAAGLYARAGYASIEAYNDNPNATRWYGKLLG
ncbi:MAG: GNAT family N-acetyltransferase [Beutenbergiaceae bacterium]